MKSLITDADIKVELIQGHASRGRGGYQPKLLVVHIQEGLGDIHDFFSGADADSTMWIPINGPIVRYLYDTDTAWTNGRWTNPDVTNPVIAHWYNVLNPIGQNSNVIALTVELEGYPNYTMTPGQYNNLIGLLAYWSLKWHIPADRDHIVGHYQVGEHKYCPGPIVQTRWAEIVKDVKQLVDQTNGVATTGVTHPNPGPAVGPIGGGQPPSTDPSQNPVKDVSGKAVWVVGAIRDFYNSNIWLGIPLGPECNARSQGGFNFDGSYQYFERGRVEKHTSSLGVNTIMLGLIGQELLAAQGQLYNLTHPVVITTT